jgi:RimJ/RimL family protein N-acetyltransferase
LAGHYPHHPHDLGVHVAIGEPSRTGRGLGRALLRAVAEGLLAADPRCPRVVAEPDVRNVPSIRAFTAAGFRPAGEITLPDKTAALLVFDRDLVEVA